MSAAARRAAGGPDARARLRTEAELIRLARVLRVQEAELAFLQEADELTLRELRISVSDHLFERASAGLRNAAKLAGLLPGPVAAKLSEHALGPVLSAWTVPMLDSSLVAAIAGRLPAPFLAETAVHLDLRRAGPLIGSVPEDKLRAAGTTLAERREFVVLASFVGHMDLHVLRGMLEVFEPETLLRAAFLIEEAERVDELVEHLPDDRLDELHVAASEHGLWEEALAMLSVLGRAQQQRFAESLARLDAAHHAVLGDVLRTEPLLAQVAEPLLDLLDAETRRAIIG